MLSLKAVATRKPDEQRDDGVGDALAKLVEVLEERHPPFERLVFVAERR